MLPGAIRVEADTRRRLEHECHHEQRFQLECQLPDHQITRLPNSWRQARCFLSTLARGSYDLYTRWPNPMSRLFASPDFTFLMKSGTLDTDPISFSIRSTASFAPPCSGPYSAAEAPASAEYGSTCELPMLRIAFVPQFCSWSACRMNSTSSACSRTRLGLYFTSVILNIMFRKLPG